MHAHPTMGTWRTSKIRKKSRGSQATGKSKGIVATALAKYICRRNRSYKHALYDEVFSKMGLKAKKA